MASSWTKGVLDCVVGKNYTLERVVKHWNSSQHPWRYLKGVWHLGTWLTGEHGSSRLRIRLVDLGDLL